MGLEAMTANQWLLYVGIPSLFAIVFLVWEWRSKRRVRLEEQSLTDDGPDHLPHLHQLEPPISPIGER
jgi:hypothetical protein